MMLRRRKKEAAAEVPLSPLIDCVFLLLIFFLVTSMFKRYERLIPVTLADPTSSVAEAAEDDAASLGLGADGSLYRASGGREAFGRASFRPLDDFEQHAAALLERRGPAAPLEVVVERGTAFQQTIDLQDRLELAGFENIRFRVRDNAFDAGRQLRGPG
jgi:biopolymer transport protein ExbD